MNGTPLDQLSHESLAKLVKTRFRVEVAPEEGVELELIQVTPRRLTHAAGLNQPVYELFSLVFLGPADPVLPQSIYAFEGERLGRSELFIVPIGRDPSGIRYEAAFNRR